jgi:hypothetical protein
MGLGILNSDATNQIRAFLLSRSLNPTVESGIGGLGSLNSNRGTPTSVTNPNGNTNLFNSSTVSSLGQYYLKPIALRNKYNPGSYEEVVLGNLTNTGGNIGTYEDYARTRSSHDFNLRQLFLGTPVANIETDTQLGIIGSEQLLFLLQQNIAANTIKNTVGRVNTDIFSLLNGHEFLIRDYQITEFPQEGLGYFGNLLQKYSGVEIPLSLIPGSAFGWLDSLFDGKPNYADCNLQELDDSTRDTITRNNQLLRFTGKGSRVQLFNLLGMNKYRPNYEDNNGDGFLNRIFGFLQQQKNNSNSSYDTLEKTRRSSGTLPIMLLQNIATSPGNEGKKGAFLKDDARSVLQPNGLPKIGWDNKDNANPGGFKRFMFSIENLAWIDHTEGLPICEIGNGDTDSNNKKPGRIMWFPPYDLKFDENVTINWTQTDFIGRGEPIWTYNNTVRSGTISFKVVVDHPSILNNLRQKPAFTEADYKKFFMGCGGKDVNAVENALNFLDVQNNISQVEKTFIETKINESVQKTYKKEVKAINKPGGNLTFKLKIFFPNASASVESNYENGTNSLGATEASVYLPDQLTPSYSNPTDFGLNVKGDGFMSQQSVNNLINLTTSGASNVDNVSVTIIISNTSVGGSALNEPLADRRFESAKGWITSQLIGLPKNIKRGHTVTASVSDTDVSSINQKQSRFALIEVSATLKDTSESSTETKEINTPTKTEEQNSVTQLFRRTADLVFKECDYFYYLEKNESFLFKKFSEKIKYFHPGFHSTTPEGLNSRLTFLHQCTRQGPALNETGKSSNLAFGRPPFCILRIGDFFHTKMIIQNMSITYDDSLWDLNPEGIGVQPRIATVNLSVTYLGGQSLMTPISKLQNALGFNFYANTEVFQHEPRFVDELITISDPNGAKPSVGEEVKGLINESGFDIGASPFDSPSLILK